MTGVLEVLTLMLTAFALAPALAHAAERPGKMRLDRETYGAVQRIYYPGFTIIGIAEPSSALGLIVLIALTPVGSQSFWLYLVALMALLAVQTIYWTVTHPVNRVWLHGQELAASGERFFAAGKHPGEAGERTDETDWRHLRDRWESSHVWRAAFTAAALLFVTLGVAQ